jgi:type I restriction enzyme S subunit
MSEWKKVKFLNLFSEPTKNGIYKSKEFHGRGAKIINMGEVFAYSFIGNQEMSRVEINDKERNSFIVKNGDLLFARRSLVESGAGKCAIANGITEETTFESSIIRVRLNENNALPLFYMYWMRSLSGRTAINSIVNGVNVKGIRATDLQNIEVDLPPLHTQHRIATILSRYDSLIENYQKQIKLLEEAAQRLYKEWFVDLHFPGHENTKIVDGVPEGWEKKYVGDMISKIQRTKQVTASNYQASGKIPVIDQSRNYIAGYTDDAECLVKVTVPYIVFGDHTRILKYIPFSFAKGADGTQLIMSNDLDRMPQTLFYNSLIEIDLSNYSYARHFKYLKEESVLLPSEQVARKYDSIVSRYYQSIQRSREQIRLLTEARDRLLPKLMSGEIAV